MKTLPAVEWQPIAGCSPISAGCLNCYTSRLAGNDPARAGLTRETNNGAVWTGQLRLNLPAMELPTLLTVQSLVYVCPHGDLFHENAPDAWLDDVFAVIAKCPTQFFQIVTKRAARMRDYCAERFPVGLPANVALGVSCEDQAETNARLPHLFATAVQSRLVTFYPLLGAIDIFAIPGVDRLNLSGLHVVMMGQEAQRPARRDWFAKIKADCASIGVNCIEGGLIE